MAEEKEELELFLKNVDEVGLLIKNLTSNNEEEQNEAIEKCDKFLTNKDCVTTNRTLINTEQTNAKRETLNTEQQDQFLKCIESDANERACRRQKNESAAKALKTKGNEHYKACRYQEAIVCYSEALDVVKYLPNIYTNRAQAYINIGNYDAAVDDCKWALKLDDQCIKAYVHCGRALQRKACFTEAISYFEKAQRVDPRKKDVIEDYISSVKTEQERFQIEHEVSLLFGNDNPLLTSIDTKVGLLLNETTPLNKLTSVAEELKTLLEKDNNGKTLFRLKKGFDCFSKTSRFGRVCFAKNMWDLPEQERFVFSMLELCKTLVENNEYNLGEILKNNILESLQQLMKNCLVERVILSSLHFLFKISEIPDGRRSIAQYLIDERDFLEVLTSTQNEENSKANVLMGFMNNLTLDERFSLKYSSEIIKMCLSWTKKFFITITGETTKNSRLMLTSTFSTLANLARIKTVRITLREDEQIWDMFPKLFERSHCKIMGETVNAGLGLLLNLLFENSSYAKKYSSSFTISLDSLLRLNYSHLFQRVVGVLRLLMTYFSEITDLVCNQLETYKILLDLIEKSNDEQTVSYSVKCLTLCVLNSCEVRKYVTKFGLKSIHHLLRCNNPTTIGNCCLILRNCFEQQEACVFFLGTGIVKDLLTIASSNALQINVKQNGAIALAKLVSNNSRFLDELRELQGLEILHSIIKTTGL